LKKTLSFYAVSNKRLFDLIKSYGWGLNKSSIILISTISTISTFKYFSNFKSLRHIL
jgi:hypothetical protein